MTLLKRVPIAVIVLISVTVIALLTYFIQEKVGTKGRRQNEGPFVEVEHVRVGSMTRKVNAVGTLVANQVVKIRPEVHGLIAKVDVKGGQMVNAGDPLFEIDDRTFRSDLKDAEAKLALAQAEYKRAEKLAASQFGPIKTRDKTFAELKMAEAALETAKTRLERTVVHAPFEGVVGIHDIALGTPVSEQTELATLVDIDPIKVDFKLPGQFLRYISVGQQVNIRVDGFEDKEFKGSIESIDATVDESGHSIGVRAEMPNKKGILKPGLFARASVVVGSKDNTLIIPAGAIELSGDEEFVFKVVDKIAVRVPIATGLRENENVEVLRGLNADDLIITVGYQVKQLRDGTPVRYQLDEPETSQDTEKVTEEKKKAPAQTEEQKSEEVKPQEEATETIVETENQSDSGSSENGEPKTESAPTESEVSK